MTVVNSCYARVFNRAIATLRTHTLSKGILMYCGTAGMMCTQVDVTSVSAALQPQVGFVQLQCRYKRMADDLRVVTYEMTYLIRTYSMNA